MQWATVNDVLGRVLVAVDSRRVGVEDVVGVVTEIEQARGGTGVFPHRPDHPADLEPLLAAVASAAVDTAAVGVAALGKVLPIPALTRHATLLMAVLDTQHWLKQALADRIGPVGTDLAFEGTGALLHSLTQSPTVPALNAAAAIERALEIRARRQVWRRRERELCLPEPDDGAAEPRAAARPAPRRAAARPRRDLPRPPRAHRARRRPRPARPHPASRALRGPAQGAHPEGRRPRPGVLRRRTRPAARAAAASCPWTARPTAGSTASTPSSSTAPRCAPARPSSSRPRRRPTAGTTPPSGRRPPTCSAAASEDGLRLGPPRTSADAPGGEIRSLLQGRRRVGTVTVAPELDPYAEALLSTAGDAGLRLVLSPHVGAGEIAGLADDVSPADEPLVETVRRLQDDGHGVLLVSAVDGPALLAADVAVAPVLDGRAPAWGADLVTSSGLADACRIVAAAKEARTFSRRASGAALTGNVLGGLLAAVGSPRYGQRKATTPGK